MNPNDRELFLIRVAGDLTKALIAVADQRDELYRRLADIDDDETTYGDNWRSSREPSFSMHNTCPAVAPNGERCGLLAGHTGGHHITWPSGIGFDWADQLTEFKPRCDITATTCIAHDGQELPGDCPRTPHDHPACKLARDHTGRHDWQDPGDNRPTTDPHAPQPVIYQIPGPPPVGRTVIDRHGKPWKMRADGHVEQPFSHSDPGGFRLHWTEFLVAYEPATLAELTDEEKASEELYGPVGMRWADPDGPPCPYSEYGDDDVDASRTYCVLRVGHGGPHVSPFGGPLGEDSTMVGPLSVTPQQAARQPCTCGRPDQHQPGCPRYDRMAHRAARTRTFPLPAKDEEGRS